MKQIAAYFLVATFGLLETSLAQCNADNFVHNCIPKLPPGFNFLKGYKVDGGINKDKIEYSYVFTSGTQYLVNLCVSGNSNDGVMVSLFDSGRNKVASSKVNDQFVSALQYSCGTTGIYYIQYTFEGAAPRCAGSALGFKR